ncbi:MAG: HEAT repeat domain-containing protein [Planctomycetes bacterium]|nr:HEAT repeat domain-containing protein [Planctomycetota bacterium]
MLCVVVFSAPPLLSQAPAKLQDAIARLKDPKNEANRVSVRKEIERLGAEAVEPLVALLKEEDFNVRLNAVMALGDLKDPRAIPALTQAIEDKRFGVRYRAILGLGQICKADNWQPQYAPPVSRIFGVLFSRVNPSQALELCAASKALSEMFNKKHGDLCGNDSEEHRKKVLGEWRKWFDANKATYGIQALRPIMECVEDLKDADAARRIAAAGEIAQRGDPNYARDLIERLAVETDPKVEKALCDAIEKLTEIKFGAMVARDGKKQALADFDLLWQAKPHLNKLGDPDRGVRLDAVVNLQDIKHKHVVDALADRLETEDDWDVTVAIIGALTKQVGEAPKIPQGADQEIRRQIIAGWKKWAEVKPYVDKLRDDKAEKADRLKAIDDLERVDDFRVVLALAEALDGEDDADILRRLVAALRRLRPHSLLVVPPDAPKPDRKRRAHDYMVRLLVLNLDGKDYLPRQDAVERIVQGKMKDRPLFEALLRLLKRAEISAQELQRVVEVLNGLVETPPKMPSTRREDIVKAWDAWWEQNKEKF